MIRQFSILHEAVHGLIHPHSKTNDFIGFIAGTFCLTPFAAWKIAHLKHHLWTGNINQDPTFVILKNYDEYSELKKRLIELSWRKGLPLLALLQHFGFWIFSLKSIFFLKNGLSLIVTFIFYAVVLSQLGLIDVVVCLIGIGFYFHLYEEVIIPQHVGLHSTDGSDHHTYHWQQLELTRSWYLHPVIEKYAVLNMNYHTEHHLFPDLPWHQLDQAHQLLLNENETLNMKPANWVHDQRKLSFKQVIMPTPRHKQNAA